MTDDGFWRRNARRYDRSIRVLNRRFPEMVAMVVEDVGGSRRVLEIAAGTGLVSLPLARVVPELTVTDLSPEMLTIIRGRLGDAAVASVDVRRADALNLDFPEARFDAVVAANVLHLLPDVDRALSEWTRVLRPSGLLCLPTFLHAETLGAQAVSRLLGLAGFPIQTRFAAGDVTRAVEKHGLSPVRAAVIPGVLPLMYLVARNGTHQG